VREYEVEPTLIAIDRRAEGLADALAPLVGRRRRVLLPQAEDARPVLAERLESAGAEVVRVIAYRQRVPDGAAARARELFASIPWGWVTFTSASTVRNLIEVLGPLWPDGHATLAAASIGPVTSAELRRFGVEPRTEAGSPSEASLVESIVEATRSSGDRADRSGSGSPWASG
jgi:uroporphyrinogen-III synthase